VHTTIAKDFDEANAHVNATTGVHGAAGAVVGTTDTQTLTNKTLTRAVMTGTATANNLAVSGTCSVIGTTTVNAVTATAVNATSLSLTAGLTVGGATTLTGAVTLTGGVSGAMAATGAVSGTTVTGSGLVKGAGLESTAGVALAQIAAPAGVASKGQVWAQSDGGIYTRSGATAGAARLGVYWGSGTSLPSTGAIAGDTYEHTGLASVMRLTAAGWRQNERAFVADTTARTAISSTYSSLLHYGFEVCEVDTGRVVTWNGTAWAKTGGPRSLLGEVTNAPSGTLISTTTYSATVASSGPVPAHLPGTVQVSWFGNWLAASNAAGFFKLAWSNSSGGALTDIPGSTVRVHNQGSATAQYFNCVGYFESDGAAKYITLLAQKDAGGADLQAAASAWHAWQL
jgi:hypothetical protein